MVELEWDGVTKREDCSADFLAMRDEVANAAHDYQWPVLLQRLERTPALVNSWRLGGTAWYTPLHQAADGDAPVDVVERMLAMGAWRTMPTAARARAVDIARDRGHDQLVSLLEPRILRPVDAASLDQIQAHFHDVIRARLAPLKRVSAMRLPELCLLTEHAAATCWFAVPGLYGGFKFHLEGDRQPMLIVESWSRVVAGSGQRHEITATGARLVDEGFV
jgi:hypothetical protein